MIISASELQNSGMTPGEIKSLWLNVSSLINGGELMHPKFLLNQLRILTLRRFILMDLHWYMN